MSVNVLLSIWYRAVTVPPQVCRPPQPETVIAGAVLRVYVPTNVKPVISVGVERLEFKAMLALVIVTEPLALRIMPFVFGMGNVRRPGAGPRWYDNRIPGITA